MRPDAVEAAKRFVADVFPACQVALLGGSVVRGEATERSDLDIFILDDALVSNYRENFVYAGWMIEAFVHTRASYRHFFAENCERARPSLPRICAEGVILRDDGTAALIQREAEELLARGPVPWSPQDIDRARYGITDALDDLIGATDPAEGLFAANLLAERVHEFVLRANGRWVGSGKWVARALRQYDPRLCDRLVNALHAFYREGDKALLARLVDEVLKPYGGTLFEGYSSGKA